MILCAFALLLLAIVAGMMLLAQTKKENLGNLYKYVSLFIIVMGFLGIMCVGAHCAMRCCHRGMQCKMMMREDRMMDDDDGCMMGHMGGHGMGCHMGMMNGCGMTHGGCCEEMMGGCCGHMNYGCHEGMGGCNENMGSCHDGMGSCNEGMGECHEGKDGGGCPMMKGEMHGMTDKKDSVKKK